MLRVECIDNDLNQPGSTNAQQENQQSPDPYNCGYEATLKELFDIIRSKTLEKEKLKNIEKLLAKEPKPDINFKGKSGNTPLHVAMCKKELEVIKLLIKNGARTDIKNDKNATPLDIAKHKGI